MARLSADAVTADDIRVYLATESDFAFELSVLDRLNRLGLSCRHAGTYEDPVTRKTREYDIHAEEAARVPGGRGIVIRLAVECKNVRSNYPLVLHRVPRAQHESFMDVVWSVKDTPMLGGLQRRYGTRVRFRNHRSRYPSGAPVAKSADQVGKRLDGSIQAADHDMFDRITQALNSAYELLRVSHYAGSNKELGVASLVIPLLVVPDERLWVIDYDDAGQMIAGPALADHATYFVDKDWSFGGNAMEYTTWYSLSHLEICTSRYLGQLTEELVGNERFTVSAVLDVLSEEFHGPGKKSPRAG